jgi:hypothetical protein
MEELSHRIEKKRLPRVRPSRPTHKASQKTAC